MSQEFGLLFDRVPEAYDRARPDYPASLVDAACSIAGLASGSHVVEVGCGTGKLTRALVDRGLIVEAIDPGAGLIEVARRNLPDAPVRFHLGRFEDVELPTGAFEAVLSATAFHWVDPAVSWSKVARLLRPGGVLALLAYIGGSLLELEPAIREAWREVLPDAAGWLSRDSKNIWEGAEARRGNVSELWSWLEKCEIASPEAAALFGDVQITTIPIEQEETTDESLALIRTTSAYLRLDPGRQKVLESRLSALIDDAGGIQRSTSFATLVTARKAADGIVAAVSRNAAHAVSKRNQDSIRLVTGLGVEGDAHLGETVKHRSRVARDPSQPNLRQVHLIHGELHDELRDAGFEVTPGQMGENITTRGLDLLGLPTGTRLHLGDTAVVEVTGLRNPCVQLDGIQPGLMAATLGRDEQGNLIRKAGMMGVVLAGGEVRPDDPIRVEVPPGPHRSLEPV